MQQITEWLARRGLGQYARVFDDNGIDFSVLPGWFTQGFDTLDLKEAKELLEQLNA